MFDFVDCVSDLPITQFFPFLFAAYPYAKVILTVRDPNKWTKQRSKKWSRTDPAPLQTMFHTVGDIRGTGPILYLFIYIYIYI